MGTNKYSESSILILISGFPLKQIHLSHQKSELRKQISKTFIMKISLLVLITLVTLLSNSLAFHPEGYEEPRPERPLGPNEEIPPDGHYLRQRNTEHRDHHHHHDKPRVIARDEFPHRHQHDHHDPPQHHHDRREAGQHHHHHKPEHHHHARDELYGGDPYHHDYEDERHQPRGLKNAGEEKVNPKSQAEKNSPDNTHDQSHLPSDLKHPEEKKPYHKKVEKPHHPVVEPKHIPIAENKPTPGKDEHHPTPEKVDEKTPGKEGGNKV